MNPQDSVMNLKSDQKLTPLQLAEALYEGTHHLQNLAEKLARQHGKAGALTFFGMMGEDVQNFYLQIAQQLIDHASEWEKNNGGACCLSKKESDRLKTLPRHPALHSNEPSTLDEAVDMIYTKFDGMQAIARQRTKQEFCNFCHSQMSGGIGMQIRNEFRLWHKDSPLRNYFINIDPNMHADHMSFLILEQVWERLTKG